MTAVGLARRPSPCPVLPGLPASIRLKADIIVGITLEPMTGIEPAYSAWEFDQGHFRTFADHEELLRPACSAAA